jgi:hypothetical protein
LRWIINAHLNRLSLAAFHPPTLRQGLSSHFFGKKIEYLNVLGKEGYMDALFSKFNPPRE